MFYCRVGKPRSETKITTHGHTVTSQQPAPWAEVFCEPFSPPAGLPSTAGGLLPLLSSVDTPLRTHRSSRGHTTAGTPLRAHRFAPHTGVCRATLVLTPAGIKSVTSHHAMLAADVTAIYRSTRHHFHILFHACMIPQIALYK